MEHSHCLLGKQPQLPPPAPAGSCHASHPLKWMDHTAAPSADEANKCTHIQRPLSAIYNPTTTNSTADPGLTLGLHRKLYSFCMHMHIHMTVPATQWLKSACCTLRDYQATHASAVVVEQAGAAAWCSCTLNQQQWLLLGGVSSCCSAHWSANGPSTWRSREHDPLADLNKFHPGIATRQSRRMLTTFSTAAMIRPVAASTELPTAVFSCPSSCSHCCSCSSCCPSWSSGNSTTSAPEL
jgi:hypothetical protein